MICGPPRMYNSKTPRCPAILLGLIATLFWTGCAGTAPSSSVVAAAPSTATAPTVAPTSALTLTLLPTDTPVPTATQTATSTPSPITRRTNTSTPMLSDTSTPEQLFDGPACSCDEVCPCNIEHVVIISIDGLRPDALEQADTPTLDALRAAGSYSSAAQTVLPSVTLVGHASMLGGMRPEHHGIYWNVHNPTLGKIKGPTLFTVAHKAGLSTAMVVGKPRLEHLVLPDSVDNYVHAGFTDSLVADRALKIIQSGLPNILFIHLPDVDSTGHATGWMSPSQLMTINRTDSQVGKLVAALEAGHYLEQTLIIITSDHGGSGVSHGTNSPEDMTIPWLAVGPGVPDGLSLESEITIYDTAATALQALQLPIPEMWDGRPVLEIFGQSLVTGE
jgi:hypothetical protein